METSWFLINDLFPSSFVFSCLVPACLSWPYTETILIKTLLEWPLVTASITSFITTRTPHTFETPTVHLTYQHFDSLPQGRWNVREAWWEETVMAKKPFHWTATGTCFPSFAFCWNARFHCNAFIILPLPRPLNEVSLSHIPLFLSSHLVLSLFALPSISLPSCVWQIQLIPTAFQPPQWLHGLAPQLGAHYLLIHRAKDWQRVCAFFVVCSLLPSFYLSPSQGTF